MQEAARKLNFKLPEMEAGGEAVEEEVSWIESTDKLYPVTLRIQVWSGKSLPRLNPNVFHKQEEAAIGVDEINVAVNNWNLMNVPKPREIHHPV